MNRFNFFLPMLAAAVTVCGLALQTSAQVTVQRIVATLEPSGAGVGRVFYNFSPPVIQENGSLAFSAGDVLIESPCALFTGSGIWRASSSGGANLIVYQDFVNWIGPSNFPTLNKLGYLAYGVQVPSPSTHNEIIGESGGMYTTLARDDRDAPQVPDGRFDGFTQFSLEPLINTANQVGFVGGLQFGQGGVTDDDDTGIWAPSAQGILALAVREGSGRVGLPDGARFEDFVVDQGFQAPLTLNASGTIAFRARMRTGFGGVVQANDSAIWTLNTNGVLTFVSREGELAPTGTGARYDDLTQVGGTFQQSFPALNNCGETAFRAPLRVGSGDVTDLNNAVVFGPDPDGQPAVVARKGNVAPGIPEMTGNRFERFSDPILNRQGRIAFSARLSSGDSARNTGLWVTNPAGDLKLIVREGNIAPGTGGMIFDDFVFSETIVPARLEMNDVGTLVFAVNLRSPRRGAVQTEQSIWAFVPGRGLVLVVRLGNQLEFAPGINGVVDQLMIVLGSGGQDGRRTSLNDAGQVAFVARTTDESCPFLHHGVFRATLPAPCRADWNNDGAVSSDDYFDFYADYLRGQADYNGDCVTNSNDFSAFYGDYFSPC